MDVVISSFQKLVEAGDDVMEKVNWQPIFTTEYK